MSYDKTLFICPKCQQRAVRSAHSGDFVHDCFGSSALANEDILVIGNWQDFTGSANANGVLRQGQVNTLQGTRGDIDGEKEQGARTDRGFPKGRFRTRPNKEYLDSDYFKKKETGDKDPLEYFE